MPHVQSKVSEQGGTTHNQTFASPLTAGNCVLVFLRLSSQQNPITSVTDNQGNTYTEITGPGGFNDGVRRLWAFKAENVGANTPTVSVNVSQAASLRWAIAEYDNVPTSSVIDAFAVGSFAASSPANSSTITSTVANDTFVGFMILDAEGAVGISPNDGSTERQQEDDAFQFQDKGVGSAGNYSTSWIQGTGGVVQTGGYCVLLLKANVSFPVITNVDGDNNITSTQTGVVITGTSFGSDGANAKIELVDGVIVSQCTKTAWTGTSITFSVVQGNVKYGNVSCKITTHAGLTTTQTVTLSPPSGYTSTNVTTLRSLTWDPNVTPTRLTPKASPADATADLTGAIQFEVKRTAGGGTATADPDGRLAWQDTVTQIQWRWHNGTVWSSAITWDLRGLFPHFNGPTIVNKTFTSTVAITSIDFAPLFSDADGGTATYTLQGGAVTGLTLSSAGTLSGTPTVPATNTNRQIRRTDNEGSFVDSNAFTIVVQAAPNPPFFSGVVPSLIIVTNTTIPTTSFATFFTFATAYSISPAVPTGLAFNTGTGDLTGTPTVRGIYGPFTVTGTGTGSPANSNTFSIEIADPPVEVIGAGSGGFSTSHYTIPKKKKRKKLVTKDIIQSVRLNRK